MSDIKLGILPHGDEDTRKDAIHMAVAQVQAGVDLAPSERVRVENGYAYPALENPIAIVDPFLKEQVVKRGTWIWIVMMPGSITKLRHEWTHPQLPGEELYYDECRGCN